MTKKTRNKKDNSVEGLAICRHRESIEGNIGTCIICGQTRQYRGDYKPLVLQHGWLNSKRTMPTPPIVEVKSDERGGLE